MGLEEGIDQDCLCYTLCLIVLCPRIAMLGGWWWIRAAKPQPKTEGRDPLRGGPELWGCLSGARCWGSSAAHPSACLAPSCARASCVIEQQLFAAALWERQRQFLQCPQLCWCSPGRNWADFWAAGKGWRFGQRGTRSTVWGQQGWSHWGKAGEVTEALDHGRKAGSGS